ncbi:MAG: hypothetical protein KAJ92_04130 [Gammaproteobacteria bacterium]|nr:hypothetical protein [Gammaproteobacteria bacterium]
MKILNHALRVLSVMLLGLALASCSDTDGPPEDIDGVAAAGAETQGTVFVVDSAGVEISQPINWGGSFKFDVRGMTAPFMLKTVASNGTDADLFSYAEEANVTVTITPLTNLAMFIANGNADLSVLYDSWASAFGNIDPLVLKDAQATVNANLSTQYTAFRLDPFTYDFVSTLFLTSGTGFDGLLDAITVDITAGIDISVTGYSALGLPDPLVFDTGIDITGYDIGGTSVAETGNYTLTMSVSVDSGTSSAIYLSINLPIADLPVDGGSTQLVEELFVSFYGTVGDIVINSVTVTGDVAETIAVVDATITSQEDGAVNYIVTYTYTQNI